MNEKQRQTMWWSVCVALLMVALPTNASPTDEAEQTIGLVMETTQTNVTEPAVDPREALPGFSFLTMTSSTTLFADDFNDNSLDLTKWTVVNNGNGVAETNNRLELNVRERMETLALVRGSSGTATFSSTAGIDASVDAARHVAGTGRVGKPEFRIVHGSDPTKWVSIQMEEWRNTVWLKDSSGTKEVLFSSAPTGFHDYRLEIKGDEYTGHLDAASKTIVSSLFSSAAGFAVELRYHTGGSSSGATDRAAFDNVLVTSLGSGTVAQDPTACFSASPTSGTPGTTVSVDASCSADLQDATSALQVRWDWQSDGTYDTSWTTTKTDSHSFSSSSTIRLQVKDTDGNTDTDTKVITISGPPSAPQNMDAECDNPHGTHLSWQAPANNGGSTVTSYKVYGAKSSNPTTVIATVSAAQTSYDHLPAWTTDNWHYRVSAVNSNGEGTKSSEVFWAPCDLQPPGSVSSLTTPSHPGATGSPPLWYSATTIEGDWSAASDSYSGIAGYGVEAHTLSSGTLDSCSVDTPSTDGSDSAADTNGPNYLWVFAVDEAGNCGPVSSIKANVDTTKPVITSKAPGDGHAVGHPQYTVEVRYDDNDAGANGDRVQFFVDTIDRTSEATINDGSLTYTPTAWTSGSHTLEIRVPDKVEDTPNTRTSVWSFTYSASSGGGGGGGSPGGGGGGAQCGHENQAMPYDGACSGGVWSNALADQTTADTMLLAEGQACFVTELGCGIWN